MNFYDGPDYLFNNRLEFKEKKLESLGLLLQYGADPTNKDSDGRNALEYARYNYDTYGPENGHFLEEVELIEEYMERMNRKMSGKVSVKEGRVFTQAGLGRRRSRKKKKSKNKKLKKGGKRSNKKGGKLSKRKKGGRRSKGNNKTITIDGFRVNKKIDTIEILKNSSKLNLFIFLTFNKFIIKIKKKILAGTSFP